MVTGTRPAALGINNLSLNSIAVSNTDQDYDYPGCYKKKCSKSVVQLSRSKQQPTQYFTDTELNLISEHAKTCKTMVITMIIRQGMAFLDLSAGSGNSQFPDWGVLLLRHGSTICWTC